jgi:hypothetical protein
MDTFIAAGSAQKDWNLVRRDNQYQCGDYSGYSCDEESTGGVGHLQGTDGGNSP